MAGAWGLGRRDGTIDGLVAITNVERTMPWSPSPAPYSLGLIRLDGADTSLLHLIAPGVTDNQSPPEEVWAVAEIAVSSPLLRTRKTALPEIPYCGSS